MSRVLLRTAWREVRFKKLRTALVSVLIALPVTAVAVMSVLVRSGELTPADAWAREHGTATYLFEEEVNQPVTVADVAPKGATSVLRSRTLYAAFDASRDGAAFRLTSDDLSAPMLASTFRLVDGRVRRDASEVVLSPALARKLNVRVGATIRLGPIARDLTVVGLAHPRASGREEVAYVDDALLPADLPAQWRVFTGGAFNPSDLGGAHRVTINPAIANPRDLQRDDNSATVNVMLLFGGLALAVMAVVISAAFAMSARRQLRTVGLLASAGASPSQQQALVVLQGLWSGLVGLAVSAVATVITLVAIRPKLASIVDLPDASYRFAVRDLAIVVALALAAAVAAAWSPARAAAQLPVLTALAGRRPLPPLSIRTPARGVAVCAAGLGLFAISALGAGNSSSTVWVLLGVLGGVLQLAGASLLAPAAVAPLGRLADHTGGALRLAARQLARSRTRSGAVIAGVAAVTGLAIAGTAVAQANFERDDRLQTRILPRDTVRVFSTDAPTVDAITGFLPVARRVPVETLAVAADGGAIASPALLDDLKVSPADRAALDGGSILLLNWPDRNRPALAEARPVVRGRTPAGAPLMLMSRATADAIGARIGIRHTIVQATRDLTGGDRARIERAAQNAGVGLDLAPLSAPRGRSLQRVVAGIAIAVAAFVALASVALSASETRHETQLLAALGAGPRTLAAVRGASAAWVAIVGALMGVALGILTTLVYLQVAGDKQDVPLRLSWPVTALVLVLAVFPVCIAVLATMGSAVGSRFARRGAAELAYE